MDGRGIEARPLSLLLNLALMGINLLLPEISGSLGLRACVLT